VNRILIVDDEQVVAEMVKEMLQSDGYVASIADRFEFAITQMEKDPFDLAIVDLMLKDKSGIDLMAAIKRVRPELPVIILTGHASVATAVEAMQAGACTYIKKPVKKSELICQIENCLEKKALNQELERLRNLVNERYPVENIVYKNIIYRSAKMSQVMDLVSIVANHDANVHIHGETGTGKELVARSIHATGHRKDAPFVAINCGAIPETLFEGELFGYVKGAFTGAEQDKRGLIAQANGGTLFLDEISEMSLNTQKKILRVIEEREFYPVGSSQPVQVDVRIITASNKHLINEVSGGKFREDLYYRVYVVAIELPPLRERKEDLLLLAKHFLSTMCADRNVPAKEFSPQAILKMINYQWPGNVRELKNVIEYAVVMSKGDLIGENAILHTEPNFQYPPIKPYKEAKMDFEKNYLIELIELAQGNISRAAKIAGKPRSQLYSLFSKYHMDPKRFRE